MLSCFRTQVPVWCQTAAGQSGAPVVWDYHVLVAWYLDDGSPGWIIDLDSTLPFPCPIDEYIASALQPSHDVFLAHPHLQRRYRVVQASQYLANFSSDRSHMRVERADGRLDYTSPPPTYPCISTSTCDNNLPRYLDMRLPEASEDAVNSSSLSADFGAVLSEASFIQLALSKKLVCRVVDGAGV